MTNRTREIFDCAQAEPLAVSDIESMLRRCNQEEIEHCEQVADNILAAIGNIDEADPLELD